MIEPVPWKVRVVSANAFFCAIMAADGGTTAADTGAIGMTGGVLMDIPEAARGGTADGATGLAALGTTADAPTVFTASPLLLFATATSAALAVAALSPLLSGSVIFFSAAQLESATQANATATVRRLAKGATKINWVMTSLWNQKNNIKKLIQRR